MPIKVEWKGLEAEIQDTLNLIREQILLELATIGEEAVKFAREGHLYQDQTGNLTSSIGFAVLDRNKIVKASKFETELNGDEGSIEGFDKLALVAKNSTSEYALILVAGMEYASYVEAMGLNVLEGAKLYCVGKVPERVTKSVERAINRLNSRLKKASK